MLNSSGARLYWEFHSGFSNDVSNFRWKSSWIRTFLDVKIQKQENNSFIGRWYSKTVDRLWIGVLKAIIFKIQIDYIVPFRSIHLPLITYHINTSCVFNNVLERYISWYPDLDFDELHRNILLILWLQFTPSSRACADHEMSSTLGYFLCLM